MKTDFAYLDLKRDGETMSADELRNAMIRIGRLHTARLRHALANPQDVLSHDPLTICDDAEVMILMKHSWLWLGQDDD